MHRDKYEILSSSVIAVVATDVEQNRVTLDTKDIANPKYPVGVITEIFKHGKRPWQSDHIWLLLALRGQVYNLVERTELDKYGRQEYVFELYDDIEPYVEVLVEQAIVEAL
jgi:GAF domain-containing protein